MDRRHFLRMGSITAVGLGFAWEHGAWLTEAWAARGATADESAKAKAIVDRLLKNGAAQTLRGAGVHTIEPGGQLLVQLGGYCLDHQFSAPSQGEPLAYRPITKYIAPELRELYVRVMRRVSAGKPAGVDVQKIVWAMRTPARGSFTEGLSGGDISFLNSVMPGGASLLQRAHRPSEYLSGSGGSSRSSGKDVLGALLPQLMRHLPFDIRQHSDDLMRQLYGRKAQKPMPGSNYKYSLLTASGVASKSESTGGLRVRSAVVNGSGEPFVFDATQWVLESPRDVQAVALPQVAMAEARNAYAGTAGGRGARQPQSAPPATPPQDQGEGAGAAQDEQGVMKEFTNKP